MKTLLSCLIAEALAIVLVLVNRDFAVSVSILAALLLLSTFLIYYITKSKK